MAKKNPTGTQYDPPNVKSRNMGGDQPPEIDTLNEAIEVKLVDVNVQVLAGVSLRDVVMLQVAATPMQVKTLTGLRIGNIAATDENEVRRMVTKAGRVVEVVEESLTCVIQIVRAR